MPALHHKMDMWTIIHNVSIETDEKSCLLSYIIKTYINTLYFSTIIKYPEIVIFLCH